MLAVQGTEAFAGGTLCAQAPHVFALWSLAYNSSLKAFKRGLGGEGLQLLEAACTLLLRLEPSPRSTSADSGKQHAESLLTAAQALLNSHWQGAARWGCLISAYLPCVPVHFACR